MGTKVLAVRIGDRYGPEYEDYLKSKIPNIDFVRTSDCRFKLQWNKVGFMDLPTDDPIVVIDIDILLMNDYMELIEYPIEKGQFLGLQSWWADTAHTGYSLNGAFYKYYPKDCKYIYKKLCSDPQYWMHHYIGAGITHGPVNGEQHFVQNQLELHDTNVSMFPEKHIVKWHKDDYYIQTCIEHDYKKWTGNKYLLDEDWHEDVKVIHYAGN